MKTRLTADKVYRRIEDHYGSRSICMRCFKTVHPAGVQTLEDAEQEHRKSCVPLGRTAEASAA